MAAQLSRIVPLLLITLICVGAVEGGYSLLEYLFFGRPVAEAPGPPAAEEAAQPLPAGARPDSQVILTRNLFGPAGTAGPPPPPAAAAAAEVVKSDLDVVLVGTVGGSEGHRAIILDKKTKKQELYREGDELKGANVKVIQRGKVILDVQGREELLDMAEAATVRPAVKAPPEPRSRRQPPGKAQPEPVPVPEPMAAGTIEAPPPVQDAPETTDQAAPPDQAQPEEAAAQEEAAAPPETAPELNPEANPEATPEAAPEAAPEMATPETAPEATPEAAPPAAEQPPPARKIARPRVIRPYRPS